MVAAENTSNESAPMPSIKVSGVSRRIDSKKWIKVTARVIYVVAAKALIKGFHFIVNKTQQARLWLF